MSMMKRAWLYVTRKKSKTFLMFLILLGIATATISGMSIKKATTDARNQVNESINASFTIRNNIQNNSGIGSRGMSNVPASAIQQIKEVDGISTYNARMIGEVDLIDLEKVPLQNKSVQYDDESMEKYKYVSDLDGMTDSSLDNKFISGVMDLEEGRHIKADDKQKVLVHKDFAQLNGLKMNDKLYVKQSDLASVSPEEGAVKEEIGLEIVGLFTGSNMSQATMESELTENQLITDLDTIKKLRGYSSENSVYGEAKFYVSDPKELASIVKEVNELPIDWFNYEIQESTNDYPALTGSLDNMDGLINKMLVGIIIVSAIILSLVLAFWINGRVHETGVLLSLGISKLNIVMQYILELFIIAILAFGLSYFTGQIIAQNIGDSMVQQAGEKSDAEVKEGLGGMQFGADPETSTVSQTLEKIDVSITLAEMGYVWLIGGLIILLSVSISSIFIIRLKPKEILSKMS